MKKKNKNFGDIDQIFNNFARINFGNGVIENFFNTIFDFDKGPQIPKTEDDLKNGFTLKWIVDKEGKSVRNNYGYLCKDGIQICNTVFRKGGMCGGFKDGFCSLILYTPNDSPEGYSSGNHVIVDETGKVCLSADNMLDYPYHIKGVVGKLGNIYYNLKTGEVILDGSFNSTTYASQSIKSEKYLFAEGSKVVYQIELSTGKLTIIEQTMMTKEAAIELMKQGTKITHHYFDKNEWMTMLSNGNILLEDGVECSPEEYWKWRTVSGWNDGYTVFGLV